MSFVHRTATVAAAAALALSLGTALAQDLRMMAPAGPAGGWDQTARELQKAYTAAGAAKTVQVGNVPGAGGTVGLAQFVNAEKGKADALMVGGMVMVGAILTNKSPVNLGMVTPLARLTGEYEAIAVHAASPFKTLADLVAAFKKDPGANPIAGGSAGGTDHIAAGLMAKAVGIDPTKINYIAHSGGGEAMATLLSGKVAFAINGYAEFEGQAKAGAVRVLAITAATRQAGIDVPTAKEQGVDLVIANWRGIFAAPGISDSQKGEQLKMLDAAVKSPSWQQTLKDKNWDNQYLPGDPFAKFMTEETARIEGVLRSVGLVQ